MRERQGNSEARVGPTRRWGEQREGGFSVAGRLRKPLVLLSRAGYGQMVSGCSVSTCSARLSSQTKLRQLCTGKRIQSRPQTEPKIFKSLEDPYLFLLQVTRLHCWLCTSSKLVRFRNIYDYSLSGHSALDHSSRSRAVGSRHPRSVQTSQVPSLNICGSGPRHRLTAEAPSPSKSTSSLIIFTLFGPFRMYRCGMVIPSVLRLNTRRLPMLLRPRYGRGTGAGNRGPGATAEMSSSAASSCSLVARIKYIRGWGSAARRARRWRTCAMLGLPCPVLRFMNGTSAGHP
ncbi:hypothetical protein L226DRAFT_256440 [Lentinus tigrinus ALCF2SS1-7]|uniref:uncharacterized protein n=1 Tax=Lentinus tigrinus ALCF2SS1-7 TaxID=1328758 RepID=UPI0011661A73|nr:hypothetical protein L226DRAFT_256440 [Lentinus tigrinus ALCF2SS1-7]